MKEGEDLEIRVRRFMRPTFPLPKSVSSMQSWAEFLSRRAHNPEPEGGCSV